MSGEYRYYEGANGERYCYAKHPTYTCPLAEPGTQDAEPTREVATAAGVLGADPDLLARVLETGHRRYAQGRRRVDGQLTEQCATCGHRMTRIGFAYWKDVPDPGEGSVARIANRLGFTAVRTVTRGHMDTKREAIEWARQNAAISRNAANELRED
jgi:hypothetical protein